MPLTFVLNTLNTNCLLYRNFLYYRTDTNYWKCTQCKSTVSTTGETEADEVKRTTKAWHDHFEMSKPEIECKKAITRIKQRVTDVTSERFSVSYANEEKKLVAELGLTAQEIAKFFPSLQSLRGTLDKRRAKVWPRLLQDPSQIDFFLDDITDQFTTTIGGKPFLQHDNKSATNRETPTDVDCQPIIDYFYKEWINGSWPRETWNHSDTSNPTTNNYLEAYNKFFNNFLQSAHPNIWKFVAQR